jgi:hypothetical protein
LHHLLPPVKQNKPRLREEAPLSCAALEKYGQDYCVIDTHNLFVGTTLEDEVLLLGGDAGLFTDIARECSRFGLQLAPGRKLSSYSGGEQSIICCLLLMSLLPKDTPPSCSSTSWRPSPLATENCSWRASPPDCRPLRSFPFRKTDRNLWPPMFELAAGTYPAVQAGLTFRLEQSLHLPRQSCLYLSGENGAGKSTFLEHVLIPNLRTKHRLLYLAQDMDLQQNTIRTTLALLGHDIPELWRTWPWPGSGPAVAGRSSFSMNSTNTRE